MSGSGLQPEGVSHAADVRGGHRVPPLRVLGRTGLEVTPLCVGTSPLGNTTSSYAREVSLEDALATVRRVMDSPITFLDTGNNYGDAERRIGIVLRERGGIPDGFVPLAAMQALQEEGLIAHLGVAGGPIDLLRRYLRTGAFAVVLTHNRYSLVDQSAEPLFAEAAALGVAVLNAALQFSLRDPRIVSTIAGVSRPERVDALVELARRPIPPELWEDLITPTREAP